MNIRLQRWIDRWIGAPLCALVSVADGVSSWFRKADHFDRVAQAPRAVVVILLSEMGSLVLAHDMFSRLKARYPDAPVHALMFRKNREILDLMQVVNPDHVHGIDDGSLLGLLRSIWASVRALRRAHVDVAIDCELFSRISSLLSWMCGATVRVGFHRHTQEGLYRGSHINRPVPYNPYQHIGAQFIGLVRAIEAKGRPLTRRQPANFVPVAKVEPPQVQLDAADVPAMRQRLAADFPRHFKATGSRKPLVLVYPSGGILPIRAWPLAHYTQLCSDLIAAGCTVAVIGLKADQALAQELVASCPGHEDACLDFTGYTHSIRELLALFHVASLLVTNDGGPGQFAALTPMPTIMLFGPETPALYGPISPRVVSLVSDFPCSPCLTAYNHRDSFCDGDNQCLKAITPAQVLWHAQRLMAPALAAEGAPA